MTDMFLREFGFVEFEFVEFGYAVGSTYRLAIHVSWICFPTFARSPTLYIIDYVFSQPLGLLSRIMDDQHYHRVHLHAGV